MTFQRGEVLLVPFPFSNLRSDKVRPAVVLSSSAYHATEPDIIIGAITSNVAAATAPVDYILSDWRQANLRLPSAFKPVVVTMDPELVVLKIGRLTERDLRAIGERLRLLLGL